MEKLAIEVDQNPDTTLAQHFVASQIATEVMDQLASLFKTPPQFEGLVVLGTAAEDFHGLGKKIVTGCLRAKMIEARMSPKSNGPELSCKN